MNNYIVGGPVSVNFQSSKSISLEIPPWTIGGGWHTYLMVDGNNTNTYSTPDNMINNTSINCKYGGPYFAVGPDAAKAWKRSYSSIYSAHYLEHPTLGPINIGFCHDENKNSCNQQNTINPIFHPTCVSGTDYTGYFAMVSAVWTKNIQSNNWGQNGYNNDVGPILWPSVGYVSSDNTNATQGLLQPSSIISGNYIYIYLFGIKDLLEKRKDKKVEIEELKLFVQLQLIVIFLYHMKFIIKILKELELGFHLYLQDLQKKLCLIM